MILSSVIAAFGIGKLSVSHNMDEYFTASGKDISTYNRFCKVFGEDDQFILLGFETKESPYSHTSMQSINSLKEEILQISGIRKAIWINDLFPIGVPIDSGAIAELEEKSLFISSNGKAVSILIEHDFIVEKSKMTVLMNELYATIDEHIGSEFRIAGRVPFTLIMEKFMKDDSGSLFLGTFVLLIFLLFWILGSIRMTLLGLLVPICSIGFTLGIMGWFGMHINLFTMLVPTLILVVSISDIIHIVKGSGPAEGINRVKSHFSALLLTSVTTAIGFASLITTHIQAILEFGTMIGVGVIFSFLFTIVLFSRFTMPSTRKIFGLNWFFDPILSWVKASYKKPFISVILFGLLTVVAFLGIDKIEMNSYLISGIDKDSEVRQHSAFFDENFAGTRPISIFIEKNQEDAEMNLRKVNLLDSLIRHHLSSSFVVGPKLDYKTKFDQFITEKDGEFYRFFGLIPDEGSKIISQKIRNLESDISNAPNLSEWSVSYTGISRMVDKNTEVTSRSVFYGLLTALGVTFVLLLFYFKAIWPAFVSIIVNIIPLLILASVYGILGIELRATNSVAFSIAFGIAIDDTLHMLASYKKQGQRPAAMDNVFDDVGRPIILTTFILALSFAPLLFSHLEAVKTLGVSMIVGCIFALMVDLLILPNLLKVGGTLSKPR